MKALLVSDIHEHNYAARSVFEIVKPDIVLDCGDHEKIENLFGYTPHLYIYGNHEPKEIDFNCNNLPMPHYLAPGSIFNLNKGEESLRVAGISGTYSIKSPYIVNTDSLDFLSQIPKEGIDVLLTHESPLLVSNNSSEKRLAKEIIKQICRIEPRYVFSGHLHQFKELSDNKDTKHISLDQISKGYAILDTQNFDFQRKICRFN